MSNRRHDLCWPNDLVPPVSPVSGSMGIVGDGMVFGNDRVDDFISIPRTRADDSLINIPRTSFPIIDRPSLSSDVQSSMSRSLLAGPDAPMRDGPKYYCRRIPIHTTECHNASVMDCSLNFKVDKNICVIGVQVPAQMVSDNSEFCVISL